MRPIKTVRLYRIFFAFKNASALTAGVFLLLAFLFGNSSLFAAPVFFITNNPPDPSDVGPLAGNEIDPSIGICPVTTSNLSSSNIFMAALSDASPGIFTAYSTNQGSTWITNLIATNNATNLPPALGEPSVAWDTYGNLFLAYLPDTYEGLAVAISTNAGQTFTLLTNLAPDDAIEEPRLVSAAAGSGTGSLWLVYKDYSLQNFPLVVQGLTSTALGSNGSFGPVETIPNSSAGGFPDIAVGPAGQVMVAYQNNTVVSNLATIFVSLNTNALGSNGNSFGASRAVVTDAIGGFTYIPAENTGIGLNATPGLAWDDNTNSQFFARVYLIYTAQGINGNRIINSCYSTNKGTTWSPENQVDDDIAGSNDHFFPRIAVDATTGVLAYSWFDCRNDLGSASVPVTYMTSGSYTFSNFVATNVFVKSTTTPANNKFSYSATDLSGGAGINWAVSIAGTNFYGLQMGTNTVVAGAVVTNIVSIYNTTNAGGTNLLVFFVGTNTTPGPPATNTQVNISFVDIFNQGYTQPADPGNEEAQLYTTVSTNGGLSFQPNQPLIPANAPILSPGVGYVSSVTRSTSLIGFGHYTGLAFSQGNFFPVWPDNSDMLGNNPDGMTNFDLYTAECIVPTADLSVYVTNSPNPVISGGAITYFLIVSNNGPFATSAVVVTNILPANVTLEQNGVIPSLGGIYSYNQSSQTIVFTWPGQTLAPNTSITNRIIVQATYSQYATNIATVTSPLPDPIPTNNTFISIVLFDCEDLALGMSASPPNADIGSPVTYTLSVTNLGPAGNGDVYVTNTLSTNLTQPTNIVQSQGAYTISNKTLIFDLGTLASNQTATISYTATTLSLGPKYQIATNTAVVSSLDLDTNLANNTAITTVTILGEDIAASLSAWPANVNIGDTITYTLNISNLGPSDMGTVALTNTLSSSLGQILLTQLPPQGFGSVSGQVITFNLGELDAGESVTISYTATALSPSNSAATNAISSVDVTSTDFDTNLINNVASATVTINGEDLAIGLSAPAIDWTNQPLTFTEVITNLGLSTTGLITVTNTLSTNLSSFNILQAPGSYTINGHTIVFHCGTLSVGQTATIMFTAMATSIGAGTDSATVASTDFDNNPANNSAQSATALIVPPPPIANFTVTPFASSAALSWTTPLPATVQVEYGLTTNYGSITSLAGPSTNPLVLLTGLTRDTNYYFTAMAWENGTLYATNGTFSTVDTLILNTFQASYTGSWLEGSPSLAGIYGSYFNDTQVTTNTPTASAAYIPNIITPGFYNVSAWYPIGTNFTANAQIFVNGATNAVVRSLNQTTNGGSWQPLATNLYFASGAGGNVVIYNDTGETNRLVAANAMMWSYVSAQDYPTNGTVPAWWASLYFGGNMAEANADYADYVFGITPGSASAGTPEMSVTLTVSNGVTVSFAPFQGGRNYQLQTATNLSTPNWQTLTNQPALAGDGSGYGIFTLSQTNAFGNFFRLGAQMSTNY